MVLNGKGGGRMKEVAGGFVRYESREEERRINRVAGAWAAAFILALIGAVAWFGPAFLPSSF